MNEHGCEKMIWAGGGWSQSRCSNKGVVEREGHWYCRTHDPVAKKEREDAKREISIAKYTTQRDRRLQDEADLALGRLVRKMPMECYLRHGMTGDWKVLGMDDHRPPDSPTPEAALVRAFGEKEIPDNG